MSKYTTELRFICENANGLIKSVGYNSISDVIAKARNSIFSFSYPIFDEDYRSVLETKIIKHFYTREICEETVGLWKLRLDAKMNEIMPFYNQLYKSELIEFNPMFTVKMGTDHKSDFTSNKNENENVVDKTNIGTSTKSKGTTASESNEQNKGSGNSTTNDDGTDLYSDTPQGSLSGVENETYLTNARKTSGKNTASSSTNNTTDIKGNVSTTEESEEKTINDYTHVRNNANDLTSIENYLENVSGYSGTTGSEMLMKYRETFLNIDMLVIEELEELFLQLW